MINLLRILLTLSLSILVFCGNSIAQDAYPNKPIKLILSFDAGGVSDVLGRALAAKIGPSIGQTIFVENRPGAGSTVAAAFVANSPADGYTVWLQDLTAHAINASLYKRLSFDSLKAFEPVTLVGYSPLMLVVPPQSPAKTVGDLVKMLKSNPAKFNYASAGSGTGNHLSAEIFKKAIGANEVVHIPYKGSAPSVQAVMANEVNFSFISMPPAIANAKAGTLKGLAVTALKRSSGAPDVPTMKEAGIDNAELVVYSGILVPAGTPKSIIEKLNKEFTKAVESEDIKALFIRNGVEPLTNNPEALRQQMQNDIAHFAPIVKASGATID
jgi:tripartite-type tricarboxylate transporter receptor subunit TctC